jgi:hypothetical protein
MKPTTKEQQCRKCKTRSAKKVNGIWRCTRKRELYYEGEGDKSIKRRRLPTCNDVEECIYRPETKDDKHGERTTVQDEIHDTEEKTVDNR